MAVEVENNETVFITRSQNDEETIFETISFLKNSKTVHQNKHQTPPTKQAVSGCFPSAATSPTPPVHVLGLLHCGNVAVKGGLMSGL